MEIKTLNDLELDNETLSVLRKEAKKWKMQLQYRLQNLYIRNNYSSDALYRATNGVFNLKEIEDRQLMLTKVEILSQIKFLNRFFNLDGK